MFHGKGVYTFSDGRKYVGSWKNGLRNGYGEFYFPDGWVDKGQWKDDKFIK